MTSHSSLDIMRLTKRGRCVVVVVVFKICLGDGKILEDRMELFLCICNSMALELKARIFLVGKWNR